MTDTTAPDPELLAAIREAFEEVPIHKFVGLKVVQPGYDGPAIMEIPIGPNALGRTGQLHGAVIALMCDVTCASAASTASTYDHLTTALVTADLHVRYLGAAKGERVRVEARVVKAGRQLIVVHGDVIDGEDKVVAVADFSAMLVPLRQPLDVEAPSADKG
ncbi:MAG TPA: PaaI family thioesterase [Acidimicrobiales bacterium]|nr:PaaI family thioesterase [Acidimicrobiales bacterium]